MSSLFSTELVCSLCVVCDTHDSFTYLGIHMSMPVVWYELMCEVGASAHVTVCSRHGSLSLVSPSDCRCRMVDTSI